jgi:hypothetical protein
MRCAQRHLSLNDLFYVLEHGISVRRAGALFSILLDKHVRKDTTADSRCWQLVGTTLVLCPCGCSVITVYRNKNSVGEVRRKKKRNLKRRDGACPSCGQVVEYDDFSL